MKKKYPVVILGAALVIAGCATSSGIPEKTVSDKPAAVEKGMEEKAPVKVVVSVPYTLRETSFYSDGYVESYKVITYNDDMSVNREDVFDSFDEIIESTVYEKISPSENKSSLYNARGELLSWKKEVTNPDGSLKRTESYSSDGKLQTASDYEYDGSGNKTAWAVEDSEGVVLSVTRYEYESGLNTCIEIYDASMKMREYFELEYADGLITGNRHFDEGGKLLGEIKYLYASGRMTEEKHLRANGSVSLVIKFENDEKGSPVKTEYFDGNGKLKDWNEKEYEYVSEEITVWK